MLQVGDWVEVTSPESYMRGQRGIVERVVARSHVAAFVFVRIKDESVALHGFPHRLYEFRADGVKVLGVVDLLADLR